MPLYNFTNKPLVPGNSEGMLNIGDESAFRTAHLEITAGADRYPKLDELQDWLIANDGAIPNGWQYPYQPITDMQDRAVKIGGAATWALCEHPDDTVRQTLIGTTILGATQFALAWSHPELKDIDPSIAITGQSFMRQKRGLRGTRFFETEVYKYAEYRVGRYPFSAAHAHLRRPVPQT
ncbi:MAG: hypothetical protein QFB86_03365 [Patescibacteria group bacterium]|nr:hypothetical protein [Patescibacteria group bacterium]